MSRVPLTGRPLWVAAALVSVSCPLWAGPQKARLDTVSCLDSAPIGRTVSPPLGWFSGDTHDHIQLCDDTVHDLCTIKRRMQEEDLDVTSVLIWDRPELPYQDFVGLVTRDNVGGASGKVIRFGVETSGLDCAEWGHLIGLNIGPEQAQIAEGRRIRSANGSTSPLGLDLCSPDRTGWFSAPVAEHFASAPGSVRGYAHQSWPVHIYDDQVGYDWRQELFEPGLSPAEVCLDPNRKLAYPNLDSLIELDLTPFKFPVLAAMDVALGNVEFLEVADMDYDYGCCGEEPEATWYGAYYKLLNAGLRVSISGGTDPSCVPARGQRLGHPRAWVDVGEDHVTYESWSRGLAAGRVSVAMGNQVFLDMTVNGQGLGSEVIVPQGENAVDIEVTLSTAIDAYETLELIQNGEVIHSQLLTPLGGRTATFALPEHLLTESSWFAARLASNRAHTGATYVIVDQEPISSCLDAEYWMVWCDVVEKETLEKTRTARTMFACQDDQVLEFVERARRVFKALADLDHHDGGFDPRWQATRYGNSSPRTRGPISIAIDGPAVAGTPFDITCLNAPASAKGLLVVSAQQHAGSGNAGLEDLGVDLLVDPHATLETVSRVLSRRNGYAQATVVGDFAVGQTLYAQYLWRDQDGGISASDAVEVQVQASAP